MNYIPIVILGMHRSGTSLVTRWLQSCGLNVGDNLLKGDYFSNPYGHFEDIEFLYLHQEMLKFNGIHKSGIDNTFPEKIFVSDKYKDKIIKLIDQKKNCACAWGWKDPRTCLFLETYKELLPQAIYIVVFRSPAAVMNSLYKRSNRSYLSMLKNGNIGWLKYSKMILWRTLNKNKLMDEYLETWNLYNTKILTHIKQIPSSNYLVVNIKNLITDETKIFSMLKNRVPELKYNSLTKVFKREILSSPNLTINNQKSIEIYNELESYC